MPWRKLVLLGAVAASALAVVFTVGCAGGRRSAPVSNSSDASTLGSSATASAPALAEASAVSYSRDSISAARAAELATAPHVLDYGNGWYHPATGNQTLGEIAALYQKDAKLVAELNRTSAAAIPAEHAMVYIPPFNNREKLHAVLARIHANPDLIPRTPWTPAKAAQAAPLAVKHADPWIAHKRKALAIIEDGDNAIAAPTRSVAAATGHAAAARAVASNRPYATKSFSLPTNPLAEEPKAKSKPATPVPSDDGGVQVASLTGEATLPSRAARAGEGMLTQITNGLAHTRAQLAGSADKASAGADETNDATGAAGAAFAPAGGTGQCLWPVQGAVVAKFNSGWHKACHGIEIAAPIGTQIHAARAGRVLMAQDFITYGKLIVIDHGDGFATAYGYSSTLRVKAGDHVTAGQVIALSGSAPHYGPQGKVFFQVRHNGLPVDPLTFLK